MELKIDLSTLFIGVFYNCTLNAIYEELHLMIQSFSTENNVKFFETKSIQDIKSQDIQYVIFLFALDHKNEFQEIYEYCKQNQIKYILILPTENYRPALNQIQKKTLDSIEEIQQKIKDTESNKNLILYSNTNEIKERIYTYLQSQYKPIIHLNRIALKNVGHFINTTIELNPEFSCIVGHNGSGKSTILKSIIVALIGNENDASYKMHLSKLVHINGVDKDGYPIYSDGSLISLDFTIDNISESICIKIQIDKLGNITVKEEGQNLIRTGDYFKTLILGFSQKKIDKVENSKIETNPNIPPNVEDLLPFLNDEHNGKLSSFAKWISDLDAMANKKEVNKDGNGQSLERKLIKDIFQIISDIAGQKIEFLQVLKQSTQDVWIKTPSSAAISIKMISIGFQSIMEWIGHFMQRMAQSFPYSEDFKKEHAICFVDEIDTFLHPIFQNKIIGILHKYFPNTQFILTTHSPLVVGGLKKEQVIELRLENDQIINSNPNFSTYGSTVKRILESVMDSNDRLVEIKNKLDQYFSFIKENRLQEALDLKKELIESMNLDPYDSKILEGEIMIRTKLAREKKI